MWENEEIQYTFQTAKMNKSGVLNRIRIPYVSCELTTGPAVQRELRPTRTEIIAQR